MSLEFDAEEAGRLLAAADDIEFVAESQSRTSPELLGAATETPTPEAVTSTAGMAPCKGSNGEMWRGEGLCQGPSLGFSDEYFFQYNQRHMLGEVNPKATREEERHQRGLTIPDSAIEVRCS